MVHHFGLKIESCIDFHKTRRNLRRDLRDTLKSDSRFENTYCNSWWDDVLPRYRAKFETYKVTKRGFNYMIVVCLIEDEGGAFLLIFLNVLHWLS